MAVEKFHEKFGTPSGKAATKVVPYMIPWVIEFIQNSPFAVMSTAGQDGSCDASPKGGKPGFITVLDEHQLLIPDIKGNRLFQSYANIDDNPHVGLVFFIPGLNYTARVNGRVRLVEREELDQMGSDINTEGEVFNPDQKALTQQALLLTVDEAYAHCPRSLSFSKLWDTEQIEKNRANPPELPFG